MYPIKHNPDCSEDYDGNRDFERLWECSECGSMHGDYYDADECCQEGGLEPGEDED